MMETEYTLKNVKYSSLHEDINRLEATLKSLGEELRQLKTKQQEIDNRFKLDAAQLSEKSRKRENVSNLENESFNEPVVKSEVDTISEQTSTHDAEVKQPKKKKKKIADETREIYTETADLTEDIELHEDRPTKKAKRKKNKNIKVTETVSSADDKTLTNANNSKNEKKCQVPAENISERFSTSEGFDLSDRIEEIKNIVTEITEQKYESKYNIKDNTNSLHKRNNFTYSPDKYYQNKNNANNVNNSYVQEFSSWRKEKLHLRDKLKNGILRLDFNGSNIAKIPGYGERVHLS